MDKKKLIIGIGAGVGVILGLVYYQYSGCNDQCVIGSNAVVSASYGGLFFGLMASTFIKKPKTQNDESK